GRWIDVRRRFRARDTPWLPDSGASSGTPGARGGPVARASSETPLRQYRGDGQNGDEQRREDHRLHRL
ncbi:MAG: hypothetical protein AVDCRST_MAG25-2805, partial [uncultured Rubrobacteraceae bacterium]